MRFSIVAILFAVTFFSVQPAAFAKKKKHKKHGDGQVSRITAKAEAFAENFASARRWKDLIKQLDGVLPSNVVKQYEKLAEDLPFPRMRVQGPVLLISDSSGARVNVLFGDNGTIFFNGREWKFRPLAKVADEVDRLESFLEEQPTKHTTSLLDSILLPAYAAVGSPSVALAAQAASAGWKADACKDISPSDPSAGDCLQMAVPMKISDASGSSDIYLPVALLCPQENGGVLQLIMETGGGRFDRTRVTYVNGKPVSMEGSLAKSRHSIFQTMFTIDLQNPASSDDREMAAGFMKTVRENIGTICSAGGDKLKAFKESLKANAGRLNPEAAAYEQQDNATESESTKEAI